MEARVEKDQGKKGKVGDPSINSANILQDRKDLKCRGIHASA